MAKRKNKTNNNGLTMLSNGQEMWDKMSLRCGYGMIYAPGHDIVDGFRAFQPENYEIKSRHEYPYSYSPRILFGNEDKVSGSVYSDRLYQWDSKKYDSLCEKHWGNRGQHFAERCTEPKKIEEFLSDYLGKKITLTMVVEWCNVSNGYPLWSLHYVEV
jgi:hypothetical protein